MRNYMNPEMNISMFDIENVVTSSQGGGQETTEAAAVQAQKYLTESKNIAAGNILTFSN